MLGPRVTALPFEKANEALLIVKKGTPGSVVLKI